MWNKLSRLWKRISRQAEARRLGIREGATNCLYLPRLTAESIVLDVGCADDADFSMLMIRQYKCLCYGVDPTRKHQPALARRAEDSNGRFRPVPVAVAAASGTLTFFESVANVSGSLLSSHRNVQADLTVSYDVEAISLSDLLDRLNVPAVDFLKLDLEGAEYELMPAVTSETWKRFRQVFVEFHHHCVAQFSPADTLRLAERMRSHGFQAFTYDDHNYLFFRGAP